jgi:hypothetical protein
MAEVLSQAAEAVSNETEMIAAKATRKRGYRAMEAMAHGTAKYLLLLTYPALLAQAVVREEKPVVVDGVTEVWRLVWKHPPKPACSTENVDAFTWQCNGFAFGERGQLDLVRVRGGRETDRLALTPFFDEVPVDPREAVIQRWETLDKDTMDTDALVLGAEVRKRPVVTVMNFADYDHDGASTEFFLQSGVEPSGKRMGVVIGISSRKSRLHAFGSARHPRKPLVLQKPEWDALRTSEGPVRILDWGCGDHGSETETDLELEATPAGIRAVRRTYGCDASFHRGKLLSTTEE